MVKKICRFLGYSAALSFLGAILAAAMGLSVGPFGDEPDRSNEPEALNEVRQSMRLNLRTIRDRKQPRLIFQQGALTTLTDIWNQTPRRVKLRALPAHRALGLDTVIPFHIFGSSWTYTASVSVLPGPGPLTPRLKLGALPVPKVLWAAAVSYARPYGLTPDTLDAQLSNVTSLKARETDWIIHLRDGKQAFALLKTIAAQAAPGGPLDDQQDEAMAPYWERLQSYNEGEKALIRRYETGAIIADVFGLVQQRSTPQTLQRESLAALLSLSAALSPPQIVKLWAPMLKPKGWQLILGKNDKGSGPKKTLRAPIWVRSRLAGRRDLSTHFAVSIALDLIAGADDMQYAGLLKEVSDDAKGGSGFDPNDILANALGQALTHAIVTASAIDAAKLVNCLANRIDTVLPTKADLDYPEGAIWGQTPAKSLNKSMDFKPAADALQSVFKARISQCMVKGTRG